MLIFLALSLLVTTFEGLPAFGLRIRPKTPRDGPRPLDLAHDVELFAACLRAGLGPAHAAAAVARVSPLVCWRQTSALSAVGVPARQAWEPMAAAGLGELAALVATSAQSGAAIARGADRLADALRTDAAAAATARAERAGVLIAMPLAVCFLPAFFILGLAPIVISLGADLLAGR